MGDIIIQAIFSSVPLFIIWLIVEKVLFRKKKRDSTEQKDKNANVEEETSVDDKENNYPNK